MLKRLVIAFVVAIVFYFSFWSFLEYLRVRKGPWEITFGAEDDGRPTLIVDQPSLGISGLKLVFEGVVTEPLDPPRTVLFDQPNTLDLPFGEWIHLDLEFQPGVVTLELFDHKVEFLPRVLYIDQNEFPWRSNETITIPPVIEKTENVVTGPDGTPSSGIR